MQEWLFVEQLLNDEHRQCHGRDERQAGDEGRAEPVVLVTLLEHGLERTESDRHRHYSHPVRAPEQLQITRLALQSRPKRREHQKAPRQVDEKDELTPEVV